MTTRFVRSQSSHNRTDLQDPFSDRTICTVPVIARSDAQILKHTLPRAQKGHTTYAISRLECKRPTTYTIGCLDRKRRRTYAISCLRAKDVHRMHNLPRAHKLYMYAISRLRAKDVFCTQSRLQSAKATYGAQKPYSLRTQTATGVFNESTRNHIKK